MAQESLHTVTIVGSKGIRRGVFDRVCETHVTHPHEYGHWTTILTGRLRFEVDGTAPRLLIASRWPQWLLWCLPNAWRNDRAFVPAGVLHTVKCLTEGTTYECAFSHRDLGGRVIQRYVARFNLADDPAYF